MNARGWHEKPGIEVRSGRWQDVLPELEAEGAQFDGECSSLPWPS